MKGIVLFLFILQCFVAISAIPAGFSLITQPDGSGIGLPLDMLKNAPFEDFYIPGWFLFIGNGIGHLVGAFCTYKRYNYFSKFGLGLGVYLVLWIVIQVYFIGGGLHVLQILYFVVGLIEIWACKEAGPYLVVRD